MTPRWLLARNHRGVEVPRTLGLLLAGAGCTSALMVSGVVGTSALGVGTAIGCLLAACAGFIDDVVPGTARGLRNHLRELASGHVTTGILKAFVMVACAIVVVSLAEGASLIDRVFGVLVIAGCGNLWNALDVVPGRALKAFLLPGAALLFAAPLVDQPFLPGLVLIGIPGLVQDLRERTMLGDAGANLLGVAVGVGLFLALPSWALPLLAVIVIAGNLAAEVVGLSTVIARVAPLRRLDGLGRLPGPPC